MNHMLRNNVNSPEEEKKNYMDCPCCIGSGELYVPSDEEGEHGIMEKCPDCSGNGLVSKEDYEDNDVDEDNLLD